METVIGLLGLLCILPFIGWFAFLIIRAIARMSLSLAVDIKKRCTGEWQREQDFARQQAKEKAENRERTVKEEAERKAAEAERKAAATAEREAARKEAASAVQAAYYEALRSKGPIRLPLRLPSASQAAIRHRMAAVVAAVEARRLKVTTDVAAKQRETESKTSKPRQFSLTEASQNGVIEVTGFGVGSWASIKVEVQSLVEYPLEVRIPPGIVFNSLNPNAQNMISRQTVIFTVTPYGMRTEEIPAACINQALEIPKASDYLVLEVERLLDSEFRGDTNDASLFPEISATYDPILDIHLILKSPAVSPDLLKILDSPLFNSNTCPWDLRRQQAAVWIITDDLSRSKLEDFLRLCANESRWEPPVNECVRQDIIALRKSFEGAEIPLYEYQAFLEDEIERRLDLKASSKL